MAGKRGFPTAFVKAAACISPPACNARTATHFHGWPFSRLIDRDL